MHTPMRDEIFNLALRLVFICPSKFVEHQNRREKTAKGGQKGLAASEAGDGDTLWQRRHGKWRRWHAKRREQWSSNASFSSSLLLGLNLPFYLLLQSKTLISPSSINVNAIDVGIGWHEETFEGDGRWSCCFARNAGQGGEGDGFRARCFLLRLV